MIGKSIETKSRLMVARPGVKDEWGMAAQSDKNVLEVDSGGGCTALWLY